MAKKTKINIGVALEGTAAGMIERAKFAGKIAALSNFDALLEFVKHHIHCPKSELRFSFVIDDERYQVDGERRKLSSNGKHCECGLDKFLSEV